MLSFWLLSFLGFIS
uniref:Uncharacterized protein n=1 Tax=Rhizophora mucronata TaxID=61149 RepID=A0A2P2NYP0_RHIMU